MSSFITTVRPILTFVARDLEKEELHRDYRGSLRFASCSQLRDEEMNVLIHLTNSRDLAKPLEGSPPESSYPKDVETSCVKSCTDISEKRTPSSSPTLKIAAGEIIHGSFCLKTPVKPSSCHVKTRLCCMISNPGILMNLYTLRACIPFFKRPSR